MTGKYRFFSPIEHVEHVESFEIKKRIISNVEVITRSDITHTSETEFNEFELGC